MLLPRTETPPLNLPTLAHGEFNLSSESREFGTLLVFYRGLHCPICATYLKELGRLMDDFAKRGVNIIAISSDGQDRARQMADKIGFEGLRFGYDLTIDQARDWGLYISQSNGKTSIGIEEPELFSEPGVFLVKSDQTLYYASVQTMPFVRPKFAEMIPALDFIIDKGYPARGEVAAN